MKQLKLDKKEIKEGAPFALLSYVLFLWILTFIFKKDNRFAAFHARHGIVIFIGNIVFLFLMATPILGILFGFCQLVMIFVSIYGMYLSITGKCERIYLISDIADKMVV